MQSSKQAIYVASTLSHMQAFVGPLVAVIWCPAWETLICSLGAMPVLECIHSLGRILFIDQADDHVRLSTGHCPKALLMTLAKNVYWWLVLCVQSLLFRNLVARNHLRTRFAWRSKRVWVAAIVSKCQCGMWSWCGLACCPSLERSTTAAYQMSSKNSTSISWEHSRKRLWWWEQLLSTHQINN